LHDEVLYFNQKEEKDMKTKRILYFLGFLLAITFFIASDGKAQPLKTETKPPIITHSFAVEKGPYGYIWKIYIEAEARDGDMFKIASVVDQPGWGHYPTDFIILKPQYRKHLQGYIQWNTFSSRTSYLREWTNITLKVSIIDKAGNESNEVVFPFTFETGVKPQSTPPAPFDQGEIPKLGYIHIDLFEPSNTGRDLESNL
jgi:hypothetical protein